MVAVQAALDAGLESTTASLKVLHSDTEHLKGVQKEAGIAVATMQSSLDLLNGQHLSTRNEGKETGT